MSAPGPRARRALVCLAAITTLVGLAGCRAKYSNEDLLLETPHPTCALETRAVPGDLGDGAPAPDLPAATQHVLQIGGRALGEVGAREPAAAYTRRLTQDGYWLRRTSSALVMGLGLLCLGALGAAFFLTLVKKRPPPRWGLELSRAVGREADAVRTLAQHGDALTKELVSRTEEVLGQATIRAEQLASRCRPLEERTDSATALAHLESLHGQLEGLLGRVERAHLHITSWSERRGKDEDEAVKRHIAAVVDELEAALKEAS